MKLEVLGLVWILLSILFVAMTGNHWIMNLISIIPVEVYLVISGVLVLLTTFVYKVRVEVAWLLFVSLLIFWGQVDWNIPRLRPESDREIENKVVVFNWNTHFWESLDNIDGLYQFLLDQNADIYQLQEAYYPIDNDFKDYSALEDLDRLREFFTDYEVIYEDEFVFMSKHPVVKTRAFSKYGFVKNEVLIEGKTISFYNVHFPAPINFEQAVKQFDWQRLVEGAVAQYDKREVSFAALERELDGETNSYYVSGDFNTTGSMGKMRRMLSQTTESCETSESVNCASWVYGGFRLWKFDYNLASAGIRISRHQNIDPKEMSDHWGQRVTVQL